MSWSADLAIGRAGHSELALPAVSKHMYIKTSTQVRPTNVVICSGTAGREEGGRVTLLLHDAASDWQLV